MSDREDLESLPFYWMTQVMNSRNRRLASVLKPHGLRVPEWRVLFGLYARKHLSMKELSDIACVDPATLSRTIDRLEKSGWLTRISDSDDMRITRLSLTTSGNKLVQRIRPSVEQLNEDAVAEIPKAAVDMLRWTMQEIHQNLEHDRRNKNANNVIA